MANEKRLIDANKILYHKSGFPKGNGHDGGLDWAFREDIDKIPTVDAVEVVRCKDCKNDGRCSIQDAMNWTPRAETGDYFCSYGERRTDG